MTVEKSACEHGSSGDDWVGKPATLYAWGRARVVERHSGDAMRIDAFFGDLARPLARLARSPWLVRQRIALDRSIRRPRHVQLYAEV